VLEKAKLNKHLTSKRSLQHQDHAKMNIRILGNAMAVQRRNDQKIVSLVCAKAQCKWDKLVIIAKQCPPLPKPTLVKLISKQLL